tara:strand:+ start:7066 stop:7425 length:360 start_codon:yes stop_codon:yes gene_type:complete
MAEDKKQDLDLLIDQLGSTGDAAPAGFSFRVMNRIVSIRLRQAERQAKRLSLLIGLVLAVTAAGGLLLSLQQGWFSGGFLTRLPVLHIGVGVSGLLALIGLDSLFETRLNSVAPNQHRI